MATDEPTAPQATIPVMPPDKTRPSTPATRTSRIRAMRQRDRRVGNVCTRASPSPRSLIKHPRNDGACELNLGRLALAGGDLLGKFADGVSGDGGNDGAGDGQQQRAGVAA